MSWRADRGLVHEHMDKIIIQVIASSSSVYCSQQGIIVILKKGPLSKLPSCEVEGCDYKTAHTGILCATWTLGHVHSISVKLKRA